MVCDILLISIDLFDVPAVVDGLEVHIGHAEFLALIDIGSALLHVKDGGQHFGGDFPPFFGIIEKGLAS